VHIEQVSLVLASSTQPSTASPYLGCSIAPSPASAYRNTSAPITIRCFAFTAGSPTCVCTPISHPFVERLIGTIRREYLDRVFFWNAVDLARKLEAFRDYYNGQRVHRALAGAPTHSAPLPLHWITTVGAALPGSVSDPDPCLTTISPPTRVAPCRDRIRGPRWTADIVGHRAWRTSASSPLPSRIGSVDSFHSRFNACHG